MKKISALQKKRALIRSKRSWRRRLARKLLKKQRLLLSLKAVAQGEDPRFGVWRDYNINAPTNFDLSESYEEVTKFLAELRKQSLVARRAYSINFKTIQSISPMGALILTAEMDRWRRIRRSQLRPAELKKWNPNVRRLLNEMGFFEVLGIKNPCTQEDLLHDEDHRFIKFISGNISDGTYAQQLRIALEEVAGTINYKIFMYNGLVEAMSNSVEHAYPNAQTDIGKRWWISGSFNKKTGRMTVMAYDQGVGIPTTLPKSPFAEFISSWLKKLNLGNTDANLIKAAMQIGKTQTGLTNRGLGLSEMKEFVMRSGYGVLRILSQRGDYMLLHSGEEKIKDHETPLQGTLVAWEIFTKEESV